MDTISLSCPSCGGRIDAPASTAGETGKCPSCDAPVDIPELPGPAAQPGIAQRRRRPEDLVPDNFPRAVAGAAAGAVVGGLVWAALVYFAQREIGWIAWGVGGLAGGGAVLLGGCGRTIAVTAAAMTVVGIFGGKVLGFELMKHSLAPQLRAEMLADGAKDSYDELVWDAQGYVELDDPGDDTALARYLEEHDFDMEPAEFRARVAPQLEAFQAALPDFDRWVDTQVEAAIGSVTPLEMAIEDLNPIDIVFALLGITTAFGIVMKASQKRLIEENRAARTAARRS